MAGLNENGLSGEIFPFPTDDADRNAPKHRPAHCLPVAAVIIGTRIMMIAGLIAYTRRFGV